MVHIYIIRSVLRQIYFHQGRHHGLAARHIASTFNGGWILLVNTLAEETRARSFLPDCMANFSKVEQRSFSWWSTKFLPTSELFWGRGGLMELLLLLLLPVRIVCSCRCCSLWCVYISSIDWCRPGRSLWLLLFAFRKKGTAYYNNMDHYVPWGR